MIDLWLVHRTNPPPKCSRDGQKAKRGSRRRPPGRDAQKYSIRNGSGGTARKSPNTRDAGLMCWIQRRRLKLDENVKPAVANPVLDWRRAFKDAHFEWDEGEQDAPVKESTPP